MAINSFNFSDGQPIYPIVFQNLVLIDALYHERRDILTGFAGYAEATIEALSIDPTTFPPDYVVFKSGFDYLMVVAGTTNKPQFASHVISSYCPIPSFTLDTSAVASFYYGALRILPTIRAAIPPDRRNRIHVTGHSYGAAAAHAVCSELNNERGKTEFMELQTFGEPKVFGKRDIGAGYNHVRIVNEGDVVQFVPTGSLTLFGIPTPASITIAIVGYKPVHYGLPWEIRPFHRDINRVTNVPDFLIVDTARFIDTLSRDTVLTDHVIDLSYLLNMLKPPVRPPAAPEFMINYGLELVGLPVIPNFPPMPDLPDAELCANWQGQTDPPLITPQTRAGFAVVSSFSEVNSFNSGGSYMPAFKGTMEFNIDNQSFEETLYSVPAGQPGSGLVAGPTDFTSMVNLMRRAVQQRMRLSYGPDVIGCINPVVPVGITIQDTLVPRASFPVTLGDVPPGIQPTAGLSVAPEYLCNAPGTLAAKLTYQSSVARQKAQVFLHGLPEGFFLGAGFASIGAGTVIGVVKRKSAPNDFWAGQLQLYSNWLYNNGLGHRYMTSPWDISGIPGPNAVPVSIWFNAAYSQYEIQMPAFVPGPGTPSYKDRYVLRGFRDFPVLNGRFSGKLVNATAPQTGLVIRIGRKMRFQPNITPGTVSLERWTPFCPQLSSSAVGAPPPGVNFYFVTEKKLGKVLNLQRGRQRNRPT